MGIEHDLPEHVQTIELKLGVFTYVHTTSVHSVLILDAPHEQHQTLRQKDGRRGR